MDKGDVHIIGAGLAGLSAAVILSGSSRRVIIHELSGHAGGRCRSYFEPMLEMQIDNGNHLLLSTNKRTLLFLEKIGSRHLLPIPQSAEYTFFDLNLKHLWKLQPNNSIVPWWVFFRKKRIPDTILSDYIDIIPFILKSFFWDRPITRSLEQENKVFRSLIYPVLEAALNTKVEQASSRLAAKILIQTLGKGGKACKPLISNTGLGPVFIDPALQYLQKRGVKIQYNNPLRALNFDNKGVISLQFDNQTITLNEGDKVILAVPAWVAKVLVPNLITPTEFSPIINLHYKYQLSREFPNIIGVLNGCAEWIFSFPGRVSVTISAADHLIDAERETLAIKVWEEIKKIEGSKTSLPPWQIVKERRATFKASSKQNSLRPLPQTVWKNLILAGDWTQTGYPATIEGAVLSGEKAAKLASSLSA